MSYSRNMCSKKTKKTKDINVKVVNMITNKSDAKTMTKHISCDCKCKFNSTACNLNQKWNNKIYQCKYENYRNCKKDCSRNPGTYISENSNYSKKYCSYVSFHVWGNDICYGYCINKNDKYYNIKCINKLLHWKSKI